MEIPSNPHVSISEPSTNRSDDLATSDDDSLKRDRRSTPMVFHCLFKCLQVALYLFIGDDGVITFLLTSIFIVVDFWTVKNVTGRMLVGLRWWTVTDEKGNEVHYFENYDFKTEQKNLGSTVFWGGQIGITFFWSLFLFFNIIRLKLFWVD